MTGSYGDSMLKFEELPSRFLKQLHHLTFSLMNIPYTQHTPYHHHPDQEVGSISTLESSPCASSLPSPP